MAIMQYSKKYIPVFSDTLNIVNRLKQVDKSYFVLFNKKSQKFEIHSSQQGENSFCLELPFSFLDERTIVYARKYRRERADEIFKEIDETNEKTELAEMKKRHEFAEIAIEKFSGGKK